MAHVIPSATSREPAPGFLEARAEEWRRTSPLQRAATLTLLAASLLGLGVVGVRSAPELRAALFPVATRDLPADADPSPIPTLEEAGVYDRAIPGGVKLAGTDPSKPAPVQEDPAERPFQRGQTYPQR